MNRVPTLWFRRLVLMVVGGLIGALLVGVPGHAPAARAQDGNCGISGLINVDTTFSPTECEIYVVTGNTTVGEGITLTIEPGTTLQFEGERVLTVSGTLIAQGTAANPITFTSRTNPDDANPGFWGYILFDDDSTDATFDADGNYTGGSILQHVQISNAGGVAYRLFSSGNKAALFFDQSNPFVDQSTIRNSGGAGIAGRNSAQDSHLVLQHTTVRDNAEYGIGLERYARVTLADLIIVKNGGAGISMSADGEARLTASVIADNGGRGFYFSRFGTSVTVADNTISGNQDGGLDLYAGTIEIRNNTIANNQTIQYGGGIDIDGRASSRVAVTGNRITGNAVRQEGTIRGNGGGIYGALGSGSEVTITDNTISNNQAGESGGGLDLSGSPRDSGNYLISNNVITGNQVATPDSGGAIRYRGNGSQNFSFTANILDGNTADGVAQDIFYDRRDNNEPMNARGNEWNAADRDEIQSRIYDGADDPALDFVDFADFKLGNSNVNVAVLAENAASLASKDGVVTITIPATAVENDMTFSQRPLLASTLKLPEGITAVYAFVFGAVSGGVQINQLPAANTIVMTLPNDALLQNTRTVAFQQGGAWVDLFPCEGCSMNGNQVTIQTACLGTFAVVDVADTVELPAGGANPCNANPPANPEDTTDDPPGDISSNVYLPLLLR